MTVNADRLWQRAQRYLADGQLDAAAITLESLIRHQPGHILARVLLSGMILKRGRVRPAVELLLAAMQFPPGDFNTVCNLALALVHVGEVVVARDCMAELASRPKRSGADAAAMARVYQVMNEHELALAAIEYAREHGQDDADFSYFRSLQLMFNGRIADAEAELARCLLMQPGFGRAALTRARLCRQTAERNHLADLHERLGIVERGGVNHAALEFALFKEYDDLHEVEQAWAALNRGNTIMRARLPYDKDREGVLFDHLITLPQVPAISAESTQGPTPIFIVGLPRSGTTLLERMLGNHSMIRCVGELSDFPQQVRWQADVYSRSTLDEQLLPRLADLDYANVGRRYLDRTRWRAPGKRYFVDKLPSNYQLAGLIHRALPHAPILHLVREPMAVCFSNYKSLFGDTVANCYSLDEMAAHHKHYRRLMQHWHQVLPGRILDVSYSALVENPEIVMREVLEFCRLPYEEVCLNPSTNSAPVATLSTAQVREPIHRHSLDEWQRYRIQLEPLRRMLDAD